MVETISRRSGPATGQRAGRGAYGAECLAPRHRGIGIPAVAAAAAQMSRAHAAEVTPGAAPRTLPGVLQDLLLDGMMAA